jgi:hypothetical protein
MKKQKLTLEQHREIGAALKRFRNDQLIGYSILIQNATPLNSPQSKAARKAVAALDQLRNVMDELVYKDYFEEIGDDFMKIYYGDSDEKHTSV